jgi:HemY protein
MLFFMAAYYGGNVSFGGAKNSVDVHIALVVLAVGVSVYVFQRICQFFRSICSVFWGKPNHERGLDSLQSAFSSMLLRDASSATRFVKIAKKYLGDIPLVSWLEGQASLANNDEHAAKSIFYALSARENETVFGAHSLWQIAKKNKSDDDALSAVNAMLSVLPNSQELIRQAIAISIKGKNFSLAKKQMSSLKKCAKNRIIEAIVHSEEGISTKSMESVKRAFRLAPELTDNAIFYAECLIKDKEYRSARKVLQKTFKNFPTQAVFDRYISCGEDFSDVDRVKWGKKLVGKVPESWVGHFCFGKLLMRADMLQPAFQNLLKAYNIEQYNFIASELTKVASMLSDPKPAAAAEILLNPLKSKHVTFLWRCAECGTKDERWAAVCRHCNGIGNHRWEVNVLDVPANEMEQISQDSA